MVINTAGTTRLQKFYVSQTEEQKETLKEQVRQVLSTIGTTKPANICAFGTGKLVYRRYQRLIFCMCIDESDNDLAAFESIHLYVTILNAYFEPVSEQDIMFSFYKCYILLDEVFLAGEVMETSKNVVVRSMLRTDAK